MNNQEALSFAKERLEKTSYNLETSNGLPCRTFYEKQEEMLMQAIPALEKQIPKPVIKHEEYPICPCCKKILTWELIEDVDCCLFCGQRLEREK